MRFRYPPSRRADVVDDYHGTPVADPYRWLEDPDADETREFVRAQNEVTLPYLASLPEVGGLRHRIAELWDTPRTDTPQHRSGITVWSHNDGLQDQPVFYVSRNGSDPEILLDPNTLSEDGAVAVVVWSLSPDGALFAYTTSEAGSDRQVARVRDTATGRDLPDELHHLRFTSLAWWGDGLFYSRFPDLPEGDVGLIELRAGDDLLFDPASAFDAGGNAVNLRGDTDGGGATINGPNTLTASLLDVDGNSGNDAFNLNAYNPVPVDVDGNGGSDVLTVLTDNGDHNADGSKQIVFGGALGPINHEEVETIINVDPLITSVSTDLPGGSWQMPEGWPINVTVDFIDWGADEWNVTIDWGDGTVETVPRTRTPAEVNTPVLSVMLPTHLYADDGTYPVTVTVTDTQDQGYDTETNTAEVLRFFTGCLNTATSGWQAAYSGQVRFVSEGDAPTYPCPPDWDQIRFGPGSLGATVYTGCLNTATSGWGVAFAGQIRFASAGTAPLFPCTQDWDLIDFGFAADGPERYAGCLNTATSGWAVALAGQIRFVAVGTEPLVSCPPDTYDALDFGPGVGIDWPPGFDWPPPD